ncbi:O-antigen ligase family protein [Cryobacterium psychrophilum]|uniref:O-antigen ligase family protein n=1 Tax=Cryobacterium psychrophilum TaxID=41988 RepID=UPI001416EDA7|nr:O-antigen ligase family protein [Cryobacterium psychrophilum]
MVAIVGLSWLMLSEVVRDNNLQGPLTVGLAALVSVFLPLVFARRHSWRQLGSMQTWISCLFGFFLVWVIFRLVTGDSGLSRNGIQNVSVYAVFVVVLLAVTTSAKSINTSQLISTTRNLAAIGSLPFFALAAVTDGLSGRFIGTGSITAIAAIGLIMSVVVPRTLWTRLFILAFFLVIFASLSRTYIVYAIFCLTLPPLRLSALGSFLRRWFARAAAAAVAAIVLMTQYAPLRDRFLVNDGATIAGLSVGTSGRINIWAAVSSHMDDWSLTFGHGAGQAEVLVERIFVVITQPHNDYLRLLYDFGLIGLLLWIIPLVSALIFTFRMSSKMRHSNEISLFLATFLLLGLLTTSGLLDNMIIYVFVMAPIAVFIGASLHEAANTNRRISHSIDLPRERSRT